ncbi:MAG: sugar ABC transporter substrate-binding protein, partial [Planctomycetota bacterium]
MGGYRMPRTLVRTAALVAMAAACILSPGCARKGAGKGSPRVALVMKSLANEFFKTMEDGARAHAAASPRKYTLVANGIKDEKDV